MSLKKYQCCDESHYEDFQYVCLKDKRVFCLKCWIKCEHFMHCQSTRCGNSSKIAHTAINRALQYRNFKILEYMSGSEQAFSQNRMRFLQLNYQICQIMRDFLQQKMPLLLWSMVNQLLLSRAGTQEIPGYHKFDSSCAQLLRLIKGDSASPVEHLETVVGAYFDVNHQLEGEARRVKNGVFVPKMHRDVQASEVMQSIKSKLHIMLSEIKKNIRKSIDDQLEKTVNQIDPKLKYKGVAFHKAPQHESFRKRQQYPYIGQLAQLETLTNEQQELYNSHYLNIQELQTNPQQLLQVSKCFLKQKLFNVYDGITSLKSAFPYKFAYPISTTLTNDPDYENMVLDLQKSSLETSDRTNPFLSSLSLIIMGRDLVMIKFFNQPKFSYSLKIYNYKTSRETFYASLLQKLQLKNIPQRSGVISDKIEFNQELTDTELVYCHFQVIYETLFLCGNDELIFEGEKVMANRGAKQFLQMVEKWRSIADIDLPFGRGISKDDLLKLFT